MEMTLTTPALLFPAISLLLLAYTNRFLVLAQLVRDLHSKYQQTPDEVLSGQIANLRKRIFLIRNMQVLGVSAFFLCVLSMFLIFARELVWGEFVFGGSLLLLMASLGISIYEIQISVNALSLQLRDYADKYEKKD